MPVNCAVVVVHVKVLVFDAPAVGAVVFCVIAVLAVAVHPLGAVTVTL